MPSGMTICVWAGFQPYPFDERDYYRYTYSHYRLQVCDRGSEGSTLRNTAAVGT